MAALTRFRVLAGNSQGGRAFVVSRPLNDNGEMEDPEMERELTPGQARSGIISGRIITILIISSLGAAVALGLAWMFFLGPR